MSKKKKTQPTRIEQDRVTVKYVKAANAWVTTTFSTGRQVQVWSLTEPVVDER